MKARKTLFFSLLFISFSVISFAQVKSEKMKVAGECGMCKKKIEKAAKDAGATYAVWNVDSKELTVKYNSASSNVAKIEKAVAAAGYDTPAYKATEEAYKKLDECCQYKREAASASAGCDDQKCAKENCMKDGVCAKDMSCCKNSDCAAKTCCKKE